MSIISKWCCVNLAILSFGCLVTAPSVGSRLPSSNFKKVDFPAPFGPTMATRESMSTPKFSRSYSTRSETPGYLKAAPCTEMQGGGNAFAQGKSSCR